MTLSTVIYWTLSNAQLKTKPKVFLSKCSFLHEKIFYKKMSLKNPKTLRKCSENLQPQMSDS